MTKYNNLIYFFYSLSTSFFFFILLFLLINFEKALGFFSIFNSSTPSLVSIVIYLCIRKLNFTPSNTLMLILGILNDIMASTFHAGQCISPNPLGSHHATQQNDPGSISWHPALPRPCISHHTLPRVSILILTDYCFI